MMKRYDSYKDSGVEWIGEVPEHWQQQKLKYLARVQPSNVDKKSYDTEQPTLLCNYVDVYKNEFIVANMSFMEATATPEEIDKFRVDEGDVLVTKDSESADDIAVPAYVKDSLEGVTCGYHLTQIKPDKEKLLGGYLFRLFQAPRYNNQFRVFANGVTRYGLSIYYFENAIIPLPPIDEQSAIANFLDDKTSQIDSLIQRKHQMIALLEEEKAAIINEAVTKGLNPDAPMKDSGIEWLGMVPAHWEVKKLKYTAHINPPKSNKLKEVSNEEAVTFLPMEKVSTDGKVDISLKRPIGEVLSGFTFFQEHDVILAKITPCFENGKGAHLNNLGSDFGFGSTEFHVLRPKENVLVGKYLYYITRTHRFKNLGEAGMTGSAGQKRVPTEFLSNYLLAYPATLKEQEEIVKHIQSAHDKIDAIVTKALSEIQLLQEYRTALISEAVMGKIDVRDYQPEPITSTALA
ncbi:restriction endonuclease subunit S [Pontibacter chinhatensis]|uniref:Type I restriction enzyme, S subunit n=1 Tax=Pontibacter chinhatensis TaxID=1436961 RepID=A0A1I2ZNM7_9BACT|nr:restriction endonuclease subunit S [Pontibacter chinhatensis]SFH39206.1 type I restriction enzyme, S subunit [Pontibacter chinhatensis]